MPFLTRALRITLATLVVLGMATATVGAAVPASMAGSSGQPGDIDVGASPLAPALLLAGSSGQPGDPDAG